MDEGPRRRVETRASGEVLRGTRAGDRRLRVSRRPETQRIALPATVGRRRDLSPALIFIAGFGAVIIVGALILALPFATISGSWTNPLDALFTATSAVCVTGLVVVDTGTYWSGFGHAVILVLIQIGGFGFMTSSTFLLLLIGRRASLRERILLQESLGGGGLGSVRSLAARIIVFTFLAEAAGTLLLALSFLGAVDGQTALWWGLFHSVSAFNNAGFDLVGGYRSLVPFNHSPVVLLTVSLLIVAGGISYTVVDDLVRCRRFVRLTLDSKIVLVASAGLLAAGMVAIYFTEAGNPATLGGMDLGPRLLNAFFHSVTPRTAGYNSIDVGQMTEPGLMVTIALMFIGGASGSTAGGIKVQTFCVLFFAIIAAVRGLEQVEAFRRQVPIAQVLRSIAVALLSIALLFSMSFALHVTQGHVLLVDVFEVVSAFATVGLSTGITPQTSEAGRVLLILTMFAGRLGPLTLALALAARERRPRYHWPDEAVKIG